MLFFRISSLVGLFLAIFIFVITFVRFNNLLIKTNKYIILLFQMIIVFLILREIYLSIYSIIIGEF